MPLGVLDPRRGAGAVLASLRPDLLLHRDSLSTTATTGVRERLLECAHRRPEAAALAAERAAKENVERLRYDVERLAGRRPRVIGPEDLGFRLDLVPPPPATPRSGGSAARSVSFYQIGMAEGRASATSTAAAPCSAACATRDPRQQHDTR